jgi:rare lipoprotein A
VKKKTAGRVFRRAASTAFLLVLVSNSPLGAVEPATSDTQLPETAACEMTQAELGMPLLAAGEQMQMADLGLRPAIDVPVTPRFDEPIVGIASFYDYPQKTASGERYDPKAFTAAAQLEIRARFGGIRFGRLYEPAYAIAEYAGKKLIIKFNDVGPLLPGRKFDLSRAAMEYFDGVDKGLLEGFKVTPLPLGRTYAAGPVTDGDLIALGIVPAPAVVQAPSVETPVPAREPVAAAVAQQAPSAGMPVLAHEPAAAAPEPQPEAVPASSPYPIDDFVPAPIGDVADLSVVLDG